jgi:cytidyltransferase-like protein
MPTTTEKQQQQHLRTALAVAGCAAAAGALAYAAYRTADGSPLIPYRYRYRPGTITGWMASALGAYSQRRRRRRPIRVYMDGCFDMMHYGHANALRQAKALGDVLVVGLIPDAEILRCKGPPVLNERERLELVGAVKWVDEVLTGVPYDLSPQFVDRLFRKHRIDYVIHGDDPCLLPDGTDAYAYAKKLGRFRVIKRTEGVSTTDIVGRMLTCTRGAAVAAARDEDPAAPHPLTKSFSQNERVARPSQGGGGAGGDELSAAVAAATAAAGAAGDSLGGGGLASVAEGGNGSSASLAAKGSASAAAAASAPPAPAAPAATAPASTSSSPAASRSAFMTAREAAAKAAATATDGGGAAALARAASSEGGATTAEDDDDVGDGDVDADKTVERVRVSQFLPTSRRLVQFSEGRPPPEGATVVYIDGAFDVFHTGHVAILKAAKEQGDFLLVGLHTDDDVSARRGPHLPIMNVHERALSVLACKHVDEVVIGAPEHISDSLLRTFNIGLVVRGKRCETGEDAKATTDAKRYSRPQELGIFRELPSPDNTTTSSIITRIVENRRAFEARNAKKVRSEAAYEGGKGYVKEV